MSNMDVDCDGSALSSASDCLCCALDGTNQDDTAFTDAAGRYIDAMSVPYVVITQKTGEFDPQTFGVQGLSAVAVLCDGKLTFGVRSSHYWDFLLLLW